MSRGKKEALEALRDELNGFFELLWLMHPDRETYKSGQDSCELANRVGKIKSLTRCICERSSTGKIGTLTADAMVALVEKYQEIKPGTLVQEDPYWWISEPLFQAVETELRLFAEDTEQDSDGFMSAREIAQLSGVQNFRAFDKELQRFRQRNPDSDAYLERSDPGRHKARFLYRKKAIQLIIDRYR